MDVDPNTFTLTPASVRRVISKKTKAIIPVHLYGQCAEMEEIMAIAKENDIAVVEDTAQAIGADYYYADGTTKKAGTIGDIGTTSFFPSKNLGCYGDGGAIFTNNDDLAAQLRMIANHGQQKKYHHDVIGVNSRLDSIQAAVLRIKLKHLDAYADARTKAADFYDEKFSTIEGIEIPVRYEKSSHVFHQYTLKITNTNRDELMEYLQKEGIPANIYYPLPIHKQKGFMDLEFRSDNLEVTEYLNRVVISLPIHTEFDEEQLNFITSKVINFVNEHVTSAIS